MTRRGYTREFKLELMRQWAAGERSCAQLVREHGVGQSVLYRWRDEYRQFGEDAFSERARAERGHDSLGQRPVGARHAIRAARLRFSP